MQTVTPTKIPSLDFPTVEAGAPIPPAAFDFLQAAARFFSDHRLAPFSPAWLAPMALAIANQGRNRIQNDHGAQALNLRLEEVKCCFSDRAVLAILEARGL